MSMKVTEKPANRISRAVFAFLLALGMSWPCGLALADDPDDGSSSTEEAQPEGGQQPADPGSNPTPSGGEGDVVEPAPEPETPAPETPEPEISETPEPEAGEPEAGESESSEPEHEPSTPEGRDAEQILKAAREAGLAGVDALAKWLNGESLTDEELVSIDLAGLSDIDADLANEIQPYQEEAKKRLAEAEEKKSAKDKGDEGKKKDDDSDESKYPAWTYAGDTSAPPTFHGPQLDTAKFVAVFGESARQLADENDLYASVMIAQAILESESGNSALSQFPNYNLFGIEGNYHGDSVTINAQEGNGSSGQHAGSADYRKYSSYEESLQDYVDLLSEKDYKKAHKSTTKSYADACEYLEGTYSESESYSEDLQDLIDAYDLTRYDEPLDYELADGGDANLADLTIRAADNLGKPYVWGATGPDGFDCSGLVVSTYNSVLGMQLPRTTYFQCQIGEDVDFADLHTGDLLFFTNSKNEACHVAMYVGEGCYIESTSPGGVQVTALSENMPAFAKRMIPTRAV